MRRILIRCADLICTMDGPDLSGADILIAGGVIEQVGHSLQAQDAEVVTASGLLVTPGLVNTHHHL